MSDTIDTKQILSGMIFILLLFSLSGCTEQKQPNGNTSDILYVGVIDSDYKTIQEAVNAAVDGTTILIRNGSYNELLSINKSICLRGESRNSTYIDLNPDSDATQISIITINADNCSIENLQITLSNHSVASQGIVITSNNNTIQNTSITKVTNAIQLIASSFNNIINNEIRNNQIGIDSMNSKENIISNNFFSNIQYNIYLSTNSDSNNVSFNVMNNSYYGIRMKGSENNKIYKNCIQNNNVGVYCCCGAQSNYIYHNCFISNSENSRESAGLVNIWYDKLTRIGNYWDNYNGYDMNQDGIGDTVYEIGYSENQDLYPLIIPPMDVPCIT